MSLVVLESWQQKLAKENPKCVILIEHSETKELKRVTLPYTQQHTVKAAMDQLGWNLKEIEKFGEL